MRIFINRMWGSFVISFSKSVRDNMLHKNPENKQSVIYILSYESKCTAVKSAVIQWNPRYNKLLYEDHLEISHPQVAKNLSDNVFEILISREFLNSLLKDANFVTRT